MHAEASGGDHADILQLCKPQSQSESIMSQPTSHYSFFSSSWYCLDDVDKIKKVKASPYGEVEPCWVGRRRKWRDDPSFVPGGVSRCMDGKCGTTTWCSSVCSSLHASLYRNPNSSIIHRHLLCCHVVTIGLPRPIH